MSLGEFLKHYSGPALLLASQPQIELFLPPEHFLDGLKAAGTLGYRKRAQQAHRMTLSSPDHSLDLCLHWRLDWDVPWEPVLAAADGLEPEPDHRLLLQLLALRRRGWRPPLGEVVESLRRGAAAQPSHFFEQARNWGVLPLLPLLGDALERLGVSHPFAGKLPEELRRAGRARMAGAALSKPTRFDRWLAHPRGRPWGLWLEAWGLYWVVEALLRGPGYLRLKRWLDLEVEPLSRGGMRGPVIEAVLAMGKRHPCRPQCLARAIVLCWMLRRRGLGGRVRLGAGRKGEQFQAHAWPEAGGQRLDVGESFWEIQPFEPDR